MYPYYRWCYFLRNGNDRRNFTLIAYQLYRCIAGAGVVHLFITRLHHIGTNHTADTAAYNGTNQPCGHNHRHTILFLFCSLFCIFCLIGGMFFCVQCAAVYGFFHTGFGLFSICHGILLQFFTKYAIQYLFFFPGHIHCSFHSS